MGLFEFMDAQYVLCFIFASMSLLIVDHIFVTIRGMMRDMSLCRYKGDKKDEL